MKEIGKNLSFSIFEKINIFLILLKVNKFPIEKKILETFYFLGLLFIEKKNKNLEYDKIFEENYNLDSKPN